MIRLITSLLFFVFSSLAWAASNGSQQPFSMPGYEVVPAFIRGDVSKATASASGNFAVSENNEVYSTLHPELSTSFDEIYEIAGMSPEEIASESEKSSFKWLPNKDSLALFYVSNHSERVKVLVYDASEKAVLFRLDLPDLYYLYADTFTENGKFLVFRGLTDSSDIHSRRWDLHKYVLDMETKELKQADFLLEAAVFPHGEEELVVQVNKSGPQYYFKRPAYILNPRTLATTESVLLPILSEGETYSKRLANNVNAFVLWDKNYLPYALSIFDDFGRTIATIDELPGFKWSDIDSPFRHDNVDYLRFAYRDGILILWFEGPVVARRHCGVFADSDCAPIWKYNLNTKAIDVFKMRPSKYAFIDIIDKDYYVVRHTYSHPRIYDSEGQFVAGGLWDIFANTAGGILFQYYDPNVDSSQFVFARKTTTK